MRNAVHSAATTITIMILDRCCSLLPVVEVRRKQNFSCSPVGTHENNKQDAQQGTQHGTTLAFVSSLQASNQRSFSHNFDQRNNNNRIHPKQPTNQETQHNAPLRTQIPWSYPLRGNRLSRGLFRPGRLGPRRVRPKGARRVGPQRPRGLSCPRRRQEREDAPPARWKCVRHTTQRNAPRNQNDGLQQRLDFTLTARQCTNKGEGS